MHRENALLRTYWLILTLLGSLIRICAHRKRLVFVNLETLLVSARKNTERGPFQVMVDEIQSFETIEATSLEILEHYVRRV